MSVLAKMTIPYVFLLLPLFGCFSLGTGDTTINHCLNETIDTFPANVHVKSISGSSQCKLSVHTNVNLAVILTPYHTTNYTYAYVVNDNWKTNDCQRKQIVSILDLQDICVLYLYDQFPEIHFQHVDSDLEMFQTGTDTCHETLHEEVFLSRNQTDVAKCSVAEYDGVIRVTAREPRTDYEYYASFTIVSRQSIEVASSIYDVASTLYESGAVSSSFNEYYALPPFYAFYLIHKCPMLCSCHLSERKWTENCPNGVKNYLVVYEPDTMVLSFKNSGLTTVSSSAFNGLVELSQLTLSGNHIVSLPHDVFKPLQYLQSITLEYNNLGMMPLSDRLFDSLKQLVLIDLSGNKLQVLPEHIFDSVINLQQLYLGNNELSVLPFGLFDSLTHLQVLFLTVNHLTTLPEDIFRSLHNVITLSIDQNRLMYIHPNAFNGLDNIYVLELQLNYLTTLPDKIFYSLETIYSIFLYGNQISTFHLGMLDIHETNREDRFFMIGNVTLNTFDFYRLIDISANGVYSLDDDTFNNVNISHFQSHDNFLTELSPDLFKSLPMLQLINVRNNSLETLPDGLLDIHIILDYLDLGHNEIKSLPESIFHSLHQLQTLRLNNNELTKLNDSLLVSLTELNILDIGNNDLTDLQKGILHSLVKLKILDLVNNNINTLPPDTFQNCFNLEILRLDRNVLETLPMNIFNTTRKLKTLFLSQNELSILQFGLFKSLTKLKNLDLSYNALQYLPYYIFHSTRMLEYLNMTHNKLTNLPYFENLSKLQILDVSFNRLKTFIPDIFKGLTHLKYLSFSDNHLSSLPDNAFDDLKSLVYLDLSKNYLNQLQSGLFVNQKKLVTLSLANNVLSNIHRNAFLGLRSVLRLDLDRNLLSHLGFEIFEGLTETKFVNLSHNNIKQIDQGLFNFSNTLDNIDMRKNELHYLNSNSFHGLRSSKILVDNYATCCFIRNKENCVSENPQPAYLTCKRMLPEATLRISMWCLGISAVLFNTFAFYTRRKGKVFVQTILISHLSISDFLMGINMVFLASADLYYGDFFPSFSNQWRGGVPCKIAGVLSILSSEASVFFITLISFDRFLGVKFPFSSRRLTQKSAQKCASIVWLFAVIVSIVPSVLSSFMDDIFEVSEVCVGIPIVKRPVTTIEVDSVELAKTEFRANIKYSSYYVYYIKGVDLEEDYVTANITFPISSITGYKLATYFSIFLFIGLNFLCFIMVPFFYIQILFAVKKTAQRAQRNLAFEKELRMTIKSMALVFTDFCCWVPIATVCVLVQCGLVKVSPDVYAWTVAFILPINSSINPFLYTLSSSISDHFSKTRSDGLGEVRKS